VVPATALVGAGIEFDLPIILVETEALEGLILWAKRFGPDARDGGLAGEGFEEGPGRAHTIFDF
jgi:hypothetical protein